MLGHLAVRLNIVALSIFILAGCAGTTFSFSEPSIVDPADASIKSAIKYIDDTLAVYDSSKSSLANGSQYFDIPIALSALAIGVEVIKEASAKAFGYTGLIAGTAKVGESYYAPDKRADIYDQGEKSLRCVRGYATRILDLDNTVTVAGTPTVLVKVYAQAAQETQGTAVGDSVSGLSLDAINASITITNATDSLRSKISKMQRHAGTPPDFSAIADQFKQNITLAEQKRQQAASIRPQAVRPGAAATPNFDVIQSMAALNSALSTLKADVNVCVAQVGG